MSVIGHLRARPAAVLLAFGYVSQLATSGLSLAFSPWILGRVGAEAYGLVGIFLIVQAWFQLLDAGLTPALTRETARYRGGSLDAGSLARTTRGLEWIVLASGLPVIALTLVFAPQLARHWVQAETLPMGEVVLVLQLMAFILLARWLSGVRRGVLIGFERHGRVYSINILVSVLRFPCIVPFFALVAPTALNYFLWQLGVSTLEMLLLWLASRRLNPARADVGPTAAVRSLRPIARFALNHALLALLWIAITQTDKLLLTRLLPLEEFGRYSLAVAAAAGVNLLALPLGQMLMPRLSRLAVESPDAGMRDTYSRTTRLAGVLLGSVAALFGAFGPEVMRAWTGDAALAAATGPVLAGYAVGNAAMALSLFTYYLQYASGRLGLHTIGTVGFLVVLVPVLWVATDRHGMAGAALAWAGLWIVYLLSWVTLTHARYLDGGHWDWLVGDVLRVAVPLAVTALALHAWLPRPDGRLELVATLGVAAATLVGVAVLASGLWARRADAPLGRPLGRA